MRVSFRLFFFFISLAHGTMLIGHRGNPRTRPENTVPSFKEAMAIGVNGLESDLRMTKDGVVVLMHDPTIARTTNGGNQFVRNLTFAEIRTYDAGSWFSPEFAGTKVPSFEELLQLVSESTNLFVVMDLKEEPIPQFVDEVVRVVQLYKMETRVLVSAWTDTMRDLFASRLPRAIMQKLGFFNGNVSDPTPWLQQQRLLGYSALSLNYVSLPIGFEDLAAQQLLSLTLWTVDDPAILARFPNAVAVITNDCRAIKNGVVVVVSWFNNWVFWVILFGAFAIGFLSTLIAIHFFRKTRAKAPYSELTTPN